MWQWPSTHAQSSSFSSARGRGEERRRLATITEESTDTVILPSSEALLFRGIPVVTTSLASQLLPSDSILQMGSDIQSQRLRSHRRRTYANSQRLRPYRRRTNFDGFIDTSSGHCNRRNLAQESISQINGEQESSYRVLTERSGTNHDFVYLYENHRSPEIGTPLPADLDLSQNHLQMTNHALLVPSDSDDDINSIESVSHSLIQLNPSYTQSNFPVSQIDNNYQNLELLEPETELSLNPLISTDNTQKEPYELNSKCLFDIPTQITYSTKPLLHFDDPFISPYLVFSDLPMPTVNAQKLANNLIKLSRYLKSPDLTELCCLDCRYVPVLPVTGKCGHTRCMRCILVNGACPCGVNAPKTLFVNTVIREITEKMMRCIKKSRIFSPEPFETTSNDKTCPLTGAKSRCFVKRRHCRSSRSIFSPNSSTHCLSRPRMPMTIQARHHRARNLVKDGNYLEAASHLARVAASSEPFARLARILLAKTISALYGQRRSGVSRELCQSVREQAAHSWLRPSDLECVLCTNTYSNPVSTPCGHTYCRSCIERSLYYNEKCALCLSSLENFSLAETRDTIFISSILSSIDVSPIPIDTDVIPVVTCCHVAFPGLPCPLFIFDPRYCLMVRRVLESGSRRFGLLACERGHTFAGYGTVLEICDCVVLEDSRCIVSTVGVSRFRIIERYDKDGCDVARVQSLTDTTATRDEAEDILLLAMQIYCKAIEWLENIDINVFEEIETAFGTFPYDDRPEELGTTMDGPNWLWWMIAILPLKSEIKILILSTRSLLKRMHAVSRTLDVMNTNSMSVVPEE